MTPSYIRIVMRAAPFLTDAFDWISATPWQGAPGAARIDATDRARGGVVSPRQCAAAVTTIYRSRSVHGFRRFRTRTASIRRRCVFFIVFFLLEPLFRETWNHSDLYTSETRSSDRTEVAFCLKRTSKFRLRLLSYGPKSKCIVRNHFEPPDTLVRIIVGEGKTFNRFWPVSSELRRTMKFSISWFLQFLFRKTDGFHFKAWKLFDTNSTKYIFL